MKKYLSFFLGFYCLYCHAVLAVNVDKIIAFGDSISDNGNLYALTRDINRVDPYVPVIPKDPPYYKGRFSNGPVWIELLAAAMKIPLEDYAYGGAWAEPYTDSGHLVPFNLGTQINFYLISSVLDYHRGDHLYMIGAGGNDYTQGRENAEYATTNTVNVIKDQIEWLIYAGAKNFLVITVPDLGIVPEVTDKGPEFAAKAHALSEMHDSKLVAMIEEEKKKYPAVKFILVDMRKYYNDIVAHPDKYSLKNVTEGCYNGDYYLNPPRINPAEIKAANGIKLDILNNASLREAYFNSLGEKPHCLNPDEYLFWDHVHPSRVMHKVFSILVLHELIENGVLTKSIKISGLPQA